MLINTGNIIANAGVVLLNVRDISALTIQLTGFGSATIQFEFTPDGTNWYALNCYPNGSTTAVTSATANGLWFANVAGAVEVRARASTYSSGTIAVVLAGSGNGDLSIPASGGGGTQYVDGASTPAHPTGTMPIFDNGGTISEVSAITGLPIQGGHKEVSFTTTTAQAVASTDVSQYRYIAVQFTSQGTGVNNTFQQSNDNSTWTSLALQRIDNTGTSTPTTSTNDNSGLIFAGPLSGRYFRINVTGISAGTTAGVVELYSVPPQPFTGAILLQSGNNGIGTVGVTAQSSGGYTPGKLISANTTNATSVKASAGTLGGLYLEGNTATVYYVKLYDKASAPTVGTDTPIAVYIVPANSTNGAGNNVVLPAQGMNFASGIAFAITGGVGDSDTTACAANAVVVNYLYK